jgi:diacylglycerol kinase family enzyme
MNKDDEIKLEVDGELPGRLPATFEIIPKALSVRVKA